MQIEQLCSDEYSYFLAHGELEQNSDSQLELQSQHLLIYETCDSNDERGLPQGSENVCCAERYDRI